MTYLRFPWATSNGDKVEPPAEEQVDDSVSYEEGYSSRYSEDPATSGTAKRIERNEYNGALFRYSTEIQQYQENGTPAFITSGENGGSPFSYPIKATVFLGGIIFRSNTASNVTTPPDASWDDISNPLTSLTGSNGITITGTGNERDVVGPPKIVPTVQIFDSPGANTWNRPTDCTYIILEMVGGGAGGGGSGFAIDGGGGGGGSGGYIREIIDVTGDASSTLDVGASGDGGNSGANGFPGSGSTFLLSPATAEGGSGGINASSGAQGGIGGINTGVSGSILSEQGSGGDSGSLPGNGSLSGGGGSSYFGSGTGSVAGDSAGINAGDAGAAGSGASSIVAGASGGNGSAGIIVITEYY